MLVELSEGLVLYRYLSLSKASPGKIGKFWKKFYFKKLSIRVHYVMNLKQSISLKVNMNRKWIFVTVLIFLLFCLVYIFCRIRFSFWIWILSKIRIIFTKILLSGFTVLRIPVTVNYTCTSTVDNAGCQIRKITKRSQILRVDPGSVNSASAPVIKTNPPQHCSS